jgi:lipoprotein-anchoring transpeptidase ErfK/SrfK
VGPDVGYASVMEGRRALILLVVAAATAAALSGGCVCVPAAASEPAPSPSPSLVVPRVVLRGPGGLWLGDTVSFSVSVDPSSPGGSVALETLRDGRWTAEATATLGAASVAVVAWTPESYGRVRLRASVSAADGHPAATSATKVVTVNRPNRHDVPYRYAHYIVTVVHEYKLYYYEHGALVRTFVVALGRAGYRTPTGTFRIYGKRKPGGGALGSCAMFYRREGGLAIHGTDQPELLRRFPRPFSHGCARMYDDEALWLYARVPKGTIVRNTR